MNAFDYEAWRPALAVFYRKDGAVQCAENVGVFRFPLSECDKRTIEALAAAWQKIPSSRVNVDENDCWVWQGGKDADGYGACGHNQRAHREMFRLFNGPISDGQVVCHACDNPSCINPAHLWLGTTRDNLADASRKGRCRGQDQTHCVNGHEYTPENTYWRPGKVASRDCRKCAVERTQSYRARKVQAA